VRASIDSSAKGPSLVEKCARRAEKDMRAVATTAGALALAGALAFGNVNTALADVPDNVPKQLFLDDAGVVQKTNGGYVEKALTKLKERTGYTVHFVITRNFPPFQAPSDYAEEVFRQWDLGENDVVVIAGSKIAKAGIYAGPEAARLLTPEIGNSVGNETFPFKATEELYSTAVSDVSNRLIAVLDGKPDPGPPEIVRESGEGTFKSKEKTEKSRSKYTTVVVALLIASVVIPMVQYYWYVKDD